MMMKLQDGFGVGGMDIEPDGLLRSRKSIAPVTVANQLSRTWYRCNIFKNVVPVTIVMPSC